jgi:hypothetical protein
MPVERRQASHGGHGRHDHGGGHGSTKSTKRPSSSAKRRTVPSPTVEESKAPENSENESKQESREREENVPTDEVPNGLTKEEEKDEREQNVNENENSEEPEVVNDNSEVKENDTKWAERSKEDDGYNIRSFNDNILEFTEIFDSDRYQNVDENYPVEDLMKVVGQISNTIEEFKQQTQNSQQQLEGLRKKMKQVKENIQFSVSRKAFEIRTGRKLL